MPAILTLLNTVVLTYVQSLKKDLSKEGFEVTLLIASIAWFDVIFLIGIYALGWFNMPSDPAFYLFWSALTLLYTVQFTFFIIGLKHSIFLAANSLPNLGFVVTTLYAVIFLNEHLSTMQICAIGLALVGSLFFFDWKPETTENLKHNKGLLIIFFSLALTPLINILYKSATLHTDAFHQFLTGRLMMDFIFYSLIFIVLFLVWYKKNPWPQVVSFFHSRKGWTYMVSLSLVSMLDSWLIFLMPISLFTMLRTVSIPAGYVVGSIKYQEKIQARYVIGGIMIIAAVIFFTIYPNP